MSNITFAPFPIPVVTPKGNGYVVYFKCNAMWENDEACVAMDDGGQYLHFNTGQLKAWRNATYGIASSDGQKTEVVWGPSVMRPLFTNDNTSWTDELVKDFALFCIEKKRALDALHITFTSESAINDFKEKHNIK